MLRTTKIIVSTSLLGFYSPILLSGDMGVEGNVTATNFIGSGAGLTGVVKTELDPVVDNLTADKWCKADSSAAVIQCDQDAPPTPISFQLWVPKTGQTGCWNESGTSRSCATTGEDGEYQMGGRTVTPEYWGDWHPSLRANPRFTDHGDGTVTDDLTGLVWLAKANCIVDNPGFDYHGNPNDGQVSWQQGLYFVHGLNAGFYNCGDTSNNGVWQTDWRLPNFNELLSLTDPSQINPALSSGHPFSGVQSNDYWSSSTPADITSYAWGVRLSYSSGVASVKTHANGLYVWPVRGGARLISGAQ